MKKNRPALCSPWSLLLFALCIAGRVSGQFSPVTLPAGLQPTESEMVVYQNNLMLVLQNAEHNSFSLHKYNGAVAAVPLPKGYNLYQDTQFEQLKDMLYFMPDRTTSTGRAELLRYDGATVTPIDIPDELIPRETIRLIGHTPFSYHDVLYIEAISLDSAIDDANPITHWIKYDGTSFSRMSLSFLYSCIRPWGPEVVSDKKLFNDKMYMRYYTYIGGRQIVIFDGVDVTLDFDSPHPDFIGEPGGCDMEVFNDLLYIPTFEPRPIDPIFEHGGLLNSYDGTTEEEVFIPSGLRYVKTTLEPYAGKLRGVMNDGSFFPQWYAYDGTNFTATPLPPGTRIYPGGDQRVYRCQLYIVLSTGSVIAPVYALYAYGDPLECAVLPAAVERIDIHAYARERDWCWTGIDVDWTLPTPCTPPCIDPLIRVALLDKPGQEVWSQMYDKPFQATYPVDDKQSFIATTAIGTQKVFQDFVVFDKELVPAGIEEVKLQMTSRDQKIQLNVATEKDVKVPFIIALQDADGKTLWQQKFTAPLATVVEVAAPQRGTTLRFMLDGSVTQVTSLSVFPNPASGNPSIEVGTNGAKLSTRLTITDFFGKTIYQKDVTAPVIIQPDLSQAPKGLYFINVAGPDGRVHRQTLVLK
ncbi:T9SS type A sorting domain-containing protein [Chryseolinea soli]|uniref:T9SS C-terminal target domain-containing protein n=1 Tax=Chryseolinea soli TaxID=2321403 RepID=A0A385SS86_9BACT|nr:T9SS type A sorting domain-containing protein [Chryseolinea soli]AYB33724.1 T9SS C-terminal target domain-containing protein [Chryseolinea soli]